MMSHKKVVQFHPYVTVWFHNLTLGDNPACSTGPPVMLDYIWNNPIMIHDISSSSVATTTTTATNGKNNFRVDPNKRHDNLPLPSSLRPVMLRRQLPLQQLQDAADRRYHAATMERQKRHHHHHHHHHHHPRRRRHHHHHHHHHHQKHQQGYPPVRRLTALERLDAVVESQASCEEDVHDVLFTFRRRIQPEIRRVQRNRTRSFRATIAVRSVQRVQRTWRKLRRGTERRRGRLVREWYEHYGTQDLKHG